tara:strand:- start:315 stop:482 length:168 start_codon:yes stop_codon:yes gene_type:complete
MRKSDKIKIYKTLNRAVIILHDYSDACDHIGWLGRIDEVNGMIQELKYITSILKG